MRNATSMLWQQPLFPGQLYGGRYLPQSMLTEGAPVPSSSAPSVAAVLVLSSQVLRQGRAGAKCMKMSGPESYKYIYTVARSSGARHVTEFGPR